MWHPARGVATYQSRQTSGGHPVRPSMPLRLLPRQTRPGGLEPPTTGLGNRCSIRLSYGRCGFLALWAHTCHPLAKVASSVRTSPALSTTIAITKKPAVVAGVLGLVWPSSSSAERQPWQRLDGSRILFRLAQPRVDIERQLGVAVPQPFLHDLDVNPSPGQG